MATHCTRAARLLLLGCSSLLGLASGCSSSAPTTVLLTIRAAGVLTPDELRLSVYGATSRVVDGQRLPATGTATLPSTVVLYPATSSGELRLHVRALTVGSQVGEGVTRVELQSGTQVRAEISLLSGRLPDRDGDGVPDDIDRCPTLPNPAQGSCGPDAGIDGPMPELGSDLPHADLPAPCEDASCPLGCTMARDRCARLTPSNVKPQGFYELGTAQLVLDGAQADGRSIEIDTDTGAITGLRTANAAVVVQGIFYKRLLQHDGTPIAVFAAASLRVTTGTTVRVRGSLPLLFYLRTTATIDGLIDLRADAKGAGPGGRAGGEKNGQSAETCPGAGRGGAQGDAIGIEWEAGGGGGGYGQTGGKGADVSCTFDSPASGGPGGVSWGTPTLEPLQGGCGGGAGGGPDVLETMGDGGRGGHGGGAIQIAAGERLVVGPTGAIDGAGGGGQGGHYGAGGGGGGSGGAILLEAPVIVLAGRLAANGGGGGAGSASSSTANAQAGSDGLLSPAQAQPGLRDPFGLGTHGGQGGAAAGGASGGVDSAVDCNGGGGGGGAGRLRLNSAVPSSGGTQSPGSTSGPLEQPW